MITMFLRILHAIGLSNLSDEEVERYYQIKSNLSTRKEIFELTGHLRASGSSIDKDTADKVQEWVNLLTKGEINLEELQDLINMQREIVKLQAVVESQQKIIQVIKLVETFAQNLSLAPKPN